MFSFEVYTGAASGVDGSPSGVVMSLLADAGTFFGRIMYTDNFYTSLSLMESMHDTYQMLLVGTFKFTKKKSRDGSDFPFHRMGNSALNKVDRGWLRSAVREIKNKAGEVSKKFKLRCGKTRRKLHFYIII